MGLKQAQGVRCALAVAGSGASEYGARKNKEMRRALALGCHRLGILNNNQTDSRRKR